MMNVRRSVLVVMIALFHLPVLAQIKALPNAVPYSNKAGNCIWLTNMTTEQVKAFYLSEINFKPEQVVPFADKTSEGCKLFYKHEGSLGWQKYSIKVTTVKIADCISYYEKHNPDLLMLPFMGLKSSVGNFDHTAADFKKIYKQYQYLPCRLYKESIDNKGNVTNEMAMLLQKYSNALSVSADNLMASGDNVAPVPMGKLPKDNWNYWLEFLRELDTIGYITLVEYSTANVK
jgi:hypothetical protein